MPTLNFSPVATSSPVAPAERIVSLDLLRGFALFGVLLSNLNDWYGTTDPAGWLDSSLAFLQSWLLESRFYTLLGFVFGVGFAIQLARADSRGEDVRPVFYRRMLALFAFGVAHVVFLWRGDILIQYALLGCFLVLFRDLRPRGVLVAALVTWLVVPYVIGLVMRGLHAEMLPRDPDGVDNWIYANGSYLQVMPVRIRGFLDWYGRWPQLVFPSFLVLFLFGLWSQKSGLIARFSDSRLLRRIFIGSLGLAVVSTGLGMVLWKVFEPPPPSTDWRTLGFWIPWRLPLRLLFDLSTWSSAGVYGAGLLLLALRPRGRAVLAPLAVLGRMPLTTYLTQSVVCSLLFYGYGLRWYGMVSFSGMLMIACTLFAAQILFSGWWLRRYRFGPAEWLWRSLAYGRIQPMRVAAPQPAPIAALNPAG
jgi:uncharacterized protein